MTYEFETSQQNFEDFASGRVMYTARGTTSFPVRLASEVVQRCFQWLKSTGHDGPYSLYDPCCGGGYLLTVIGLLHGGRINKIYASDIDPEVLEIAAKNLALLTEAGLLQRKEQLEHLHDAYKKTSHQEALASIDKLSGYLSRSKIGETQCFQGDITDLSKSLRPPDSSLNIIMTDLPYGGLAHWESSHPNPIAQFFDNIYDLLEPAHSVAAVIADKSQKLQHDKFRRIQHFKIGKRHVGLFEPIPH